MHLRSLFLAFVVACSSVERPLSAAEEQVVRAEVERAMRDAYDLSKPEPVKRMLSLYPDSGRVVSAHSGRALVSRDSVAAGIREFWEYVGVNMRDPKWEWTSVYVDVLSRSSAVVTATYRLPHRNPSNQPHVLGGAMTMVFRKLDGRWVVVQEHLSDGP